MVAGTIVTSFPTPAVDCRGITFDGKHLWVASFTTNRIYQIDRVGNTIKSFAVPQEDVIDLTFDGKYIWYTADDNGNWWVVCVDRNGNLIKLFNPLLVGSLRGLTFNGKDIYYSDDGPNLLHMIDRNNNEVKVSGFGAFPQINGMCWDGKYIWCTSTPNNTINMYDTTPTLIQSFAGPGTACSSVTFDGKNLWVIDIQTNRIYCVNRM